MIIPNPQSQSPNPIPNPKTDFWIINSEKKKIIMDRIKKMRERKGKKTIELNVSNKIKDLTKKLENNTKILKYEDKKI